MSQSNIYWLYCSSGERVWTMSSVPALLKEAQKKFQDKEYEAALALCTQAIDMSPGKPSLNLLFLHGTCGQNVEKYEMSSKSFLEALDVDTDGQLHQKIWKVSLAWCCREVLE
jgi:tetratricopeptide (TPR) repeat protein